MAKRSITLGALHPWILAARPKTLFASLTPVVIGWTMAADAGAFRWLPALAILAAAVLIQIATNFANDVYDFERGTDTETRLGPLRVTQSGLIAPQSMKRATIVVLLVALLLGVYLVYLGGLPIFVIGVLSLILAVAYTAGPYALAYTGLGDVIVLFFFGPIAVGGTYFILAGEVTAAVVWAGICVGMLATGILVVNNLRDIEGDAKSGKRTLAVRFGPEVARLEYALLLILPGIISLALSVTEPSHRWTMIASCYLFAAIPALIQVLSGEHGRGLNPVLESTGKLLFLFGLLFSLGWLL